MPVQNIDAIALKRPKLVGESRISARCLSWGSELVDGVYIELEKKIFIFRNSLTTSYSYPQQTRPV
jgi:hypothetical protein